MNLKIAQKYMVNVNMPSSILLLILKGGGLFFACFGWVCFFVLLYLVNFRQTAISVFFQLEDICHLNQEPHVLRLQKTDLYQTQALCYMLVHLCDPLVAKNEIEAVIYLHNVKVCHYVHETCISRALKTFGQF